jgi:hypothetical protein
VSSAMKLVGKRDAGNPHVRFDERGWETGRRSYVSARAHPRLYKVAADGPGSARPRARYLVISEADWLSELPEWGSQLRLRSRGPALTLAGMTTRI